MSARPANTPPYAAGCIVSTDPIVTVSKREGVLPMGLVTLAPERFEGAPSLHFFGMTWSSESAERVAAIARDFETAQRALPQARFVMLANTQAESHRLSAVGIANLLANELIFVDERLFTPPPERARRTKIYDAVYVARLIRAKRHELARAVDKVLLVYGPPEAGAVERTKAMLPNATFANHEMGGGAYKHFAETGVRDLLHACSVGLCLSAVEGAMRASLEYRLCGLPVVSTHSVGGRDRYLFGPHVRVVADDADAVAAAVRELKAKAFDPLAVREFVGQLVAFDRHNFLINVNKVVEHELGARDRFRSFAPFLRYPVAWRTPEEIFAPLDAARRARSAG